MYESDLHWPGRYCHMHEHHDEQLQLEFFESELDLCHALLDVAGPKPTTSILTKTVQGYETVWQWVGSLHDPSKFSRVTTKLDRSRDRLLASLHESATQADGDERRIGLRRLIPVAPATLNKR
jgi:hypothetical protein